MKPFYTIVVFAAFAIWFTGCKEPYDSPPIRNATQYLVVNGFLNAGNDSTVITLSRTRDLKDSITEYPEFRAQVTVLGEFGELLPLPEEPNGRYASAGLNLNPSEKYQLQILTSDGKKYLSDTIPIRITPPIDSISWRQDTTSAENKIGVNIFANTHDPTGISRFYRWEYDETWEYKAAFESFYKYIGGGQVVARADSDDIYTCYKSYKSTALELGTSSHLSQDLIFEYPLVFIMNGDIRLSYRYSILVRQYALTQEAYDFWQNLRKNTELTGSLFDAQPSQSRGNLHCVSNPDEPILGFISASTMQQQRIFISYRQMGPWDYIQSAGCVTQPVDIDPLIFFSGNGMVPLYQTPSGYIATTAICADCRLKGGGTLQKPPFW